MIVEDVKAGVNKNKKFIILDIPLLLENRINNKDDVLIFIQSKKSEIKKRLKLRNNFNNKVFNKFTRLQLPLNYKKKKSKYTIKNDFKKKTVKNSIKNILNNISI